MFLNPKKKKEKDKLKIFMTDFISNRFPSEAFSQNFPYLFRLMSKSNLPCFESPNSKRGFLLKKCFNSIRSLLCIQSEDNFEGVKFYWSDQRNTEKRKILWKWWKRKCEKCISWPEERSNSPCRSTFQWSYSWISFHKFKIFQSSHKLSSWIACCFWWLSSYFPWLWTLSSRFTCFCGGRF